MIHYRDGVALRNALQKAAEDLTQSEFTVPMGSYRFPMDIPFAGMPSGLVLHDIQRPADNPFTIHAAGTEFLFEISRFGCPHCSRAVHLVNCAHIVLDGLTVDGTDPQTLEGTLERLEPESNSLLFRAWEDSLPTDDEMLERIRRGTEFRIVPQKADGRAMPALYNVNNQWGPASLWGGDLTREADGLCRFTFKSTTYYEAVNTPLWQQTYSSDNTLIPGDDICVVFGTVMAIALDNCCEITVNNCRFCIGKGSFWENGGYGNHLWRSCYFGPRPGTRRLLGGEGNMSQGLRHGSTYENLTQHFTSDDAINIHGFWSRLIRADGCAATLNFAPVGILAGDTAEFYDADGQLVTTRTVAQTPPPLYNYNGFLTEPVVFDAPPPTDPSYCIRWPASECNGWVIRGCTIDNNYQRILVNSGTGVFEHNRVRYSGSNLALTSTTEIYEGGFLHDITVRDNVFLYSTNHPGGATVALVQTPAWCDEARAHRVTIEHNLFVGCGKMLSADHADTLTLKENRIAQPILYGVSEPTPADLVTVRNSVNVESSDNRLFGAEASRVLTEAAADPFVGCDALLRQADALTSADDTVF